MDENFTKFNKEILDGIANFINSSDDLLYLSGFRGCGKSEIINYALEETMDLGDILLFRHLCFENSAIDDFLLSFYDTLRYYSINKVINLKKSLTENFAQKVSFYFKNLDKKSLIIIDNFEIISKNSEIIDFLAHLGKYENVKLILVSRVTNSEFFEDKGLLCQTIDIKPNDYETFKMKLETTVDLTEESDIKELYEKTNGYELYLKMTIRYLNTVNVTLKEFMEELKKREMEFDDFLLSKIVSLVPPIYVPFLQNMAALSHSVRIDFIENYGLGDVSQVNYLYRKLLISKFADEIYLKDYLKEHFLNSLTLQEKINNYRNLINIYEQELAKSPKDRLLRLSRESIRKQIEFVKTKIPNINQGAGLKRPNFSYISHSQNVQTPWYAKLANLNRNKIEASNNAGGMPKSKPAPVQREMLGEEILSEEEKILLNEFRKNKAKETAKAPGDNVSDLLREAEEFEAKYDYNNAIKCLMEANSMAEGQNSAGKILLKLARNNAKINDFEAAIKYFGMAADIFTKTGQEGSYTDVKLEMGNLYKNLYRFEKSKNEFDEVINYKGIIAKNTVAKAHLGLGEIYEMENDFKAALESYQNALSASDLEHKDPKLLAEIYYRTAVLHDDGQDTQKALEYYQISIEYGEKSDDEGRYLSICHANSGLIYAENGDSEKAAASFKAALEIDEKEENPNGIYFASRQLSSIYRDVEPELAHQYLMTALEAAKKLDDTFKIALAHLELGDYYYNSRENKKALQNYLEAKSTLGASISAENEQRISVRINDMKVKMDETEFEEIMSEYEPKAD